MFIDIFNNTFIIDRCVEIILSTTTILKLTSRTKGKSFSLSFHSIPERKEFSQLENGKLNCYHSTLSNSIQFISLEKNKYIKKRRKTKVWHCEIHIQFNIMLDGDTKKRKRGKERMDHFKINKQ
jgi:hypothetical protein